MVSKDKGNVGPIVPNLNILSKAKPRMSIPQIFIESEEVHNL
jgi:hypothetical protein